MTNYLEFQISYKRIFSVFILFNKITKLEIYIYIDGDTTQKPILDTILKETSIFMITGYNLGITLLYMLLTPFWTKKKYSNSKCG